MAQPDIERYDMVEAPNECGLARYQRRRDGKTAMVKTTWFKTAPGNDGVIPRSRTKAIRMLFVDWE